MMCFLYVMPTCRIKRVIKKILWHFTEMLFYPNVLCVMLLSCGLHLMKNISPTLLPLLTPMGTKNELGDEWDFLLISTLETWRV